MGREERLRKIAEVKLDERCKPADIGHNIMVNLRRIRCLWCEQTDRSRAWVGNEGLFELLDCCRTTANTVETRILEATLLDLTDTP